METNNSIKYLFNKTNETYLFGKGGLIWNKTLGRISSLVNTILNRPAKASQKKPVVASQKSASISEDVAKLKDYFNSIREFGFRNSKNKTENFVKYLEKTYNNNRENHDDNDDDVTLVKEVVEGGFKQDTERVTIEYRSGNQEFRGFTGNTCEDKLSVALELLQREFPNDKDKQLKILNCLQQNTLLFLIKQITTNLSNNGNENLMAVQAFGALEKTDVEDKDCYISIQFTQDDVLIRAQEYIKIVNLTASTGIPVIYLRASLYVTIPKSNFDEAKGTVVIHGVSAQREEVLLTTERTKQAAANRLY